MSDGVLILAGATASGKSDLAIELARAFDAEIVGADSRQIYRGMPVGTAAPSPQALSAVAHHLVGFLDPRERYSAARYANDALAAIREIRGRGRRAIVVGGTGFYLRALTGGVDLAPQHDEAQRARLAREAKLHPPAFLHEWLMTRDPQRARVLHPGDTYRVLRALEVALSPQTRARDEALSTLASDGIAWQTVFLDVPVPDLDARIAHRTAAMLESGLLEEAESVGGDAVAASAVGYPQALAFLRGWCTRDELRDLLERATRRYARRQRAWFRGERDVLWLPAERVAAAAREKLGWPANGI